MQSVRFEEKGAEDGAWRIATLRPSGELSQYVEALHAYDERGELVRRRRELPDGAAVLIFNLASPLTVEHPVGRPRAFGEGEGFFGGASTTYAVTEMTGDQVGVEIKFTLLGARLVLGRPLGDFSDPLVEPSDALGREATELRDRLAEARTNAEKLTLLAETVERRLSVEAPLAPELTHGIRRLRRGDARIADVARETGISREHFSKAFRREFGVTPKAFARVRRFSRALKARAADPSLDGAALDRDVGAALDFLTRAFGFKEEMRVGTPSGGVHGQASFQGQLVMTGQSGRFHGLRTPSDEGCATMGVFVYLADVDAHYERAKAAGAEIVDPPKDVEYGRTYWANDLEGHPWFFTTPPKSG